MCEWNVPIRNILDSFSDKERILRLREKVANAQQKLESIENNTNNNNLTRRKFSSPINGFDMPINKPNPNIIIPLSKNNSYQELKSFHKKNPSDITELSMPYSSTNTSTTTNGNTMNIEESNMPNSNNSCSNNIANSKKNNQMKISFHNILSRMKKFKASQLQAIKIISYIESKMETNKSYYYDFCHENDQLSLRVLIQFIYEELESLSRNYEIKDKTVEILEKKIEEKDFLIKNLTEERVELNSQIKKLSKSACSIQENTTNPLNLFLKDLQNLVQNLIDELTNSQIGSSKINEAFKANIVTIFRAYLNQLNKMQNLPYLANADLPPYISDGNNDYTKLDPNKLQEFFNSTEFAYQDIKSNILNGDVFESKKFARLNDDIMSKYMALEHENQKLKEKIDELLNEREKFHQIHVQPLLTSNQNYSMLLDELKKCTLDKQELDSKLREFEKALLKSEIKNTEMTNKLVDYDILIKENQELKKKLEEYYEIKKSNEQNNNALKEFREEFEKLTLERKIIEKNYNKVLNDKEDLLIKYETMIQSVQIVEKNLQEKDKIINLLNQEKVAMENVICQLKDNEKKYKFDGRQSGDLENTLYLTQKELETAKKSLCDYNEKLKKLQEKNQDLSKMLEKNSNTSSSTNKYVDAAAMEQMAMIILSKTKNGQNINENANYKLNFLYEKETQESFNRYYKDNISKYISKLEETKWLCNLIIQNSDTISRSHNDQLPMALVVLKEDLEQKRNMIQNKIKEANIEIERCKADLKVISENNPRSMNDNIPPRAKEALSNRILNMNENQIQDEIDPKNTELYRIRDENDQLKGKIQTQFLEINSLKTQLRLLNSMEDTKISLPKRESFKKISKFNHLNSTNIKNSRTINPDEEDDLSTPQNQPNHINYDNNQFNQNDFLLMLHIQATSLEMLFDNDVLQINHYKTQ